MTIRNTLRIEYFAHLLPTEFQRIFARIFPQNFLPAAPPSEIYVHRPPNFNRWGGSGGGGKPPQRGLGLAIATVSAIYLATLAPNMHETKFGELEICGFWKFQLRTTLGAQTSTEKRKSCKTQKYRWKLLQIDENCFFKGPMLFWIPSWASQWKTDSYRLIINPVRLKMIMHMDAY